jgi:hypothetical protein
MLLQCTAHAWSHAPEHSFLQACVRKQTRVAPHRLANETQKHSFVRLTLFLYVLHCCCCCTACTGPPDGALLTATNAAWGCSGPTASGSTCNAVCDKGYTAQAGTSFKAQCSLGAWGNAGPQDTDSSLVCEPSSEWTIAWFATIVHMVFKVFVRSSFES